MKSILNIKFYRFFTLNFLMVVSCEAMLINSMNGVNHDFPWFMFLMMIAVTIPIIVFQYPLLNIRTNWLYRSLIFYLSMLTFLFFFGLIWSWNTKVGSSEAGTWLARFDGAFRFAFVGHLIGWIALVLIILVNRITASLTLK